MFILAFFATFAPTFQLWLYGTRTPNQEFPIIQGRNHY